MSWISRLVTALRSGRTATDLDDELQFHIDERINDLVHNGMARDEAERVARRELGNTLQLRESIHEVQSVAWLESLFRDFRFGLRMLAKYRTASVVSIASLAIAIGSCTAAFALIDALIFRHLPVPSPGRLIDIARVMPAFMSPGNQPSESDVFSYSQYQLLHDTLHDRADLFAMQLSPGLRPAVFDESGGESENIRAETISGGGFDILGVQPVLGRLIQVEDDSLNGGDPVAVLSEAFWQRRFGGSNSVLGRMVTLGRRQFQIVGVAARPFGGVQPGYLTDVWLPLTVAENAGDLNDPDSEIVHVWGRLHAGVERSSLREPAQTVIINFLQERARINPPRNFNSAQLQQLINAPVLIRDASGGGDSLFRYQFRRPLLILGMICTLVLLIACSNVANLMLARASARSVEMALRISLGAARSRLMQQMLIESGQLAAMACLFALLFAAFVAPAIVVRLGSTEFPAWLDVAMNSRIVAFAVSLSLFTVLLFGMIPTVRASATSPHRAIKVGDPYPSSRNGTLRWMLAAQIGFSVAVVFLAGLLLLSFRKLIGVDLGFARQNVVLFDIVPRDPQDQRSDSGAELLEHLRSLPDVRAASISAQRPMGGDMVWIMNPVVRLPGAETEAVRPREVPVSAGFFNAMQIRWITGRDFLPHEMLTDSPAVIVNQAFVDKFLKGQDPIGQIFEKLGDNPPPERQQIIGVVANARYNNFREPVSPTIYTPLRRIARSTVNIRTGAAPATLLSSLRKEIESAAPAMRVFGSIVLESQIDNVLVTDRLLAMLAGFFSIVALLLAAVGLYGVMNYTVVRRTREVGIRVALGAPRGAVMRLIISDTSIPLIAGGALGIAFGIGMARYLASQLFGVTPTDFWSLAAPLAAMLATAVVGVVPPALRAANADPLIALKHE